MDPREESRKVEDLARVPFACRSLTFDGANFWTNHRAGNEIVSFALPDRRPNELAESKIDLRSNAAATRR